MAQLAQSEVGNIQPPRALVHDDDYEQETPNKRFKSRSWFLTLNNPEDGDQALLAQFFDTFCSKYIFQLEVGEKCGTPHFQGVTYFPHAVHDTMLKQVAPRGIWKRTISWIAAVKYCSKSKTRVDGPWSKGITLRAEVRVVSDLRPWQAAELLRLEHTMPDDRTVRWIWDSVGNTGKTKFAIYCLQKLPGTVIVSGKGSDAAHILAKAYAKHDILLVIFTYTRSVEQYVSYSLIESIKDGLVVSGKYDSTVLNFNPPHVLVLANFAPDMTKLSADRWSVVNLD